MDADKSGVIELNDIKGRFDASKHPDVIANKRTADEVLRYVDNVSVFVLTVFAHI
jgi:hypothetical protein